MTRKHTKHSASFKAKVAMAALKGDKTLAELSDQFGVHQNQISQWKVLMQNNAEQLFDRKGTERKQHENDVEKLHAKIGQITMERDFLSKALGR